MGSTFGGQFQGDQANEERHQICEQVSCIAHDCYRVAEIAAYELGYHEENT